MTPNSPMLSLRALVTDPGCSTQAVVRLAPKPDRRQSEDRRRVPRGGRRATDVQVSLLASRPIDAADGAMHHRTV